MNCIRLRVLFTFVLCPVTVCAPAEGSFIGDSKTVIDNNVFIGDDSSSVSSREILSQNDSYKRLLLDATCPALKLPHGAARWECTNNYNYNSYCTVTCAIGFRVVRASDSIPSDQATMKCQANGTWTKVPVCKEASAPTITNCPGYTKAYADRAKRSTNVTWDDIIATDSDNGTVNVTQVKGQPRGSTFTEGGYEIAYEAMNDAGLMDTCIFYVDVEVRHCSAPVLNDSSVDVNCTNHFMYGLGCSLSCRRGLIQGATSMSCERKDNKTYWDFLGAEPTCIGIGCTTPGLPSGGSGWNCSKSNSVCGLECGAGYKVARHFDGSGGLLQCNIDGSWEGTAECTADVGAIMGAINEQKQELNSIKTMLTNIVDQLKNSGNGGGTTLVDTTAGTSTGPSV